MNLFPELLITGGRHPANNTFTICVLSIVVLCTLGLIGRSIYQKKYWGNGIFPPHLKYSEENLGLAYVCMAALIVRKDRSMMLDKMLFIDSYIRRQFRDLDDSYRLIFNRSLGTPIRPETVVAWMDKHSVSVDKRIQFVNFLMNLALADGIMNRMEFVTISKFIESLKLSQNMLNDFVNANYEKQKREQQTQRPTSPSLQQKYLSVLGLTGAVTKVEIKQTYRRLAKMYHPDRFAQEKPEVLNKAKEKFQQLQEAYDWLMK